MNKANRMMTQRACSLLAGIPYAPLEERAARFKYADLAMKQLLKDGDTANYDKVLAVWDRVLSRGLVEFFEEVLQ